LDKFLLRYPNDPNVPHAWLLSGFVEQEYNMNYEKAERLYRQALDHVAASAEIRQAAETRLKSARATLAKTGVERLDAAETYAVLSETSDRLSDSQSARLAALLQESEPSVRARLARKPGILAERLKAPQALGLAEALEKGGVHVVLFPRSRFIALPEAVTVKELRSG